MAGELQEGPNGFRAAEAEYVRASDELLALLELGRHELSPATVAVVERNLEIIDDAIEETRRALERDPGDPRVGYLLASMYEQKIDLLRRTARLTLRS
jgi:hypothetical protein